MKVLNALAIGVISTLAVSAASAQVSVGAGVSNVGGDGVDFTGVGIDVTGKVSDYLGWSVASQFGGSEDEGFVDIDLDYFIAAKLRPGITVGQGFLFLTLGYGYVSLEGSAFGFSAEESESDFIYGVGFETFFGSDATWGLGLEYNTGAGDFDELDQVMGTLRYRF